MTTFDYKSYGFREVKPTETELRAYLKQFCGFTDKRAYVPQSNKLVNYIESKGIEIDNLSDVPIDKINRILKHFKILPKTLFFHESDKFSKYDSDDFDKIIEQTLINKYRSTFFELDDLFEEFEDLTEEEIEKKKEKRRKNIENRIEEDKKDLISFLPIFYDSLQQVNMHEGKIIIAYSVNGNIIDIFSETGKKISIDDFENEDEIVVWRESNLFESCKISHDKKSILINFLGRLPSQVIFKYTDKTFQLVESDGSGDDLSNFYLPKEIDAVYKKAMILKERKHGTYDFSVKIGSQEWTTHNLETSCFSNGDRIMEASTNDEWENAALSQQPAWCYYKNNDEMGEKYGKLYNWYAVSDPRGLAPAGWHIPSVEEWQQLQDHLEKNACVKLQGGNNWHYDNSLEVIFSKEPVPVRKFRKHKNQNSSGFSALPGGSRGAIGNVFFAEGDSAYWWTSSRFTKEEDEAHFVLLYVMDKELQIGNHTSKKAGLSVRCIRDTPKAK